MYDVYVKCLILIPNITLFKEASVLDNILPHKMLQYRKETFHKTVLGVLKHTHIHTHFSRILGNSLWVQPHRNCCQLRVPVISTACMQNKK